MSETPKEPAALDDLNGDEADLQVGEEVAPEHDLDLEQAKEAGPDARE
jgi:hypothetical protein